LLRTSGKFCLLAGGDGVFKGGPAATYWKGFYREEQRSPAPVDSRAILRMADYTTAD
jgi:hypothetical protein